MCILIYVYIFLSWSLPNTIIYSPICTLHYDYEDKNFVFYFYDLAFMHCLARSRFLTNICFLSLFLVGGCCCFQTTD